MTDFYVKIPNDKVEFFAQLIENLGFEYEKLFSSEGDDMPLEDNDEELFFIDSDD
ncbi:MAG: hypothetical protein PF541_14005 [Prolixibacteraceae bacterium]|jgi:hypothetical protein|nr:hypothetical protein [Prolixibacteraceae bacterium]